MTSSSNLWSWKLIYLSKNSSFYFEIFQQSTHFFPGIHLYFIILYKYFHIYIFSFLNTFSYVKNLKQDIYNTVYIYLVSNSIDSLIYCMVFWPHGQIYVTVFWSPIMVYWTLYCLLIRNEGVQYTMGFKIPYDTGVCIM